MNEGHGSLEDRLMVAIGEGGAALAVINVPELVIASREEIHVHESPLTAALVVSALALEADGGLQSICHSQASYLLKTAESPGFWRFSKNLELILPPHTASSAYALAALKLVGCAAFDYRQALDAILCFAQTDGFCPAWLVDGLAPRPGRNDSVDLAANVNLLSLAVLLRRPLPRLASSMADLVNQHGLNCRLSSLSCASPFVLAYFLSRWLREDTSDVLQHLKESVISDCLWRSNEAMLNPLDCALVTNCLLDLGKDAVEPDWHHRLGEMLAYLVQQQTQTALWPALPIFVDRHGNVYGSIQATTAICLEALSKYRRFRAQHGEAPLGRAGARPRTWHPWKCKPPGEPERVPRPGTLEDTLKAVTQGIPPVLVSPEVLENLRRIACCLPGSLTSGVGLECRLSGSASHVDLLLCIPRDSEGLELLVGHCLNGELLADLLTIPAWKLVHEFCRQWSSCESILWANVTDLWLEFDVNGPPPKIPVPSVFVCLPEMRMPVEKEAAAEVAERIRMIVSATLSVLCDGSLTVDLARNLEICFQEVPAGAHVYAIGAMLARPTEAIRVCIKDIQPDQILGYLQRIQWTGSYHELRPIIGTLSTLVDRVHLDIDVGSRILAKVGMECSFKDHRQPVEEPRWRAFIDYLVSTGLCTPDKGEALLTWPSEFHCFEELGDMVVEESYFRKMLSHLKLSQAECGEIEAKAYIGAWRVFSRRGRAEIPDVSAS